VKEGSAEPCSQWLSTHSSLQLIMILDPGACLRTVSHLPNVLQQLSGLWYHNRTHHPDVFAAQNHRSPKFSSLQCSSCDKTFSNTVEHKKHIKTEHTGDRRWDAAEGGGTHCPRSRHRGNCLCSSLAQQRRPRLSIRSSSLSG
jgi:hypothetical protein